MYYTNNIQIVTLLYRENGPENDENDDDKLKELKTKIEHVEEASLGYQLKREDTRTVNANEGSIVVMTDI